MAAVFQRVTLQRCGLKLNLTQGNHTDYLFGNYLSAMVTCGWNQMEPEVKDVSSLLQVFQVDKMNLVSPIVPPCPQLSVEGGK